MTNTLKKALDRINFITEDIGTTSRLNTERSEPMPKKTPRFTEKKLGFPQPQTSSLRYSTNSQQYQNFLNRLHSSEEDWQRYSGVLVNDTKFDSS